MVYEEFPPDASLSPVVASFWRFDLEPHDPDALEHVVPPDGTINLAMAFTDAGLAGAVIVGPRVSALRVSVRRHVRHLGVRFRLGAASGLFGANGRDLRDRVVPIDEVAPARAAALRASFAVPAPGTDDVRRLMTVVQSGTTDMASPDSLVGAMVDAIVSARGRLRVRTLSSGMGISYRQALRRFQEAVGLSPKELARLVRIRWACLQAIEASAPPWVDVSVAAGFADQSHLSREFQDVFGWSPALVREYLQRIEHIHVRP